MHESASLPLELKGFVESASWTVARTMPDWPHEYIVRGSVDQGLFVRLVLYIRTHGYEGRFYSRGITYYDHGGLVYWTMGAPVEETVIINRCRKEDSYEYRRTHGTLPPSLSLGADRN